MNFICFKGIWSWEIFSNVESIVKRKNLFPGGFVWEVCTPVYQVPNALATSRPCWGRMSLCIDPDGDCSAAQGCLTRGMPSYLCFPAPEHLHPLTHPLPHARSTAHFCARAMFQALRYVPGLPFRSWGPGVEGLRNGVVLCSGDTSVSSTRQVLGDQRRALVATWGGRKTPSVEACHYLLLRL